ncbi:MAG: hypothetical protein OXE52_13840 [Chloroflexi bacterium]|nr:hypothetical protein [Chloroflexota bacterium]
MIDRLRQNRGHLRINPQDFAGATRGSRFYPMLYMMTRVYGTLDFDSGIKLQRHLLGKNTQLELHHLFPKARLSKYGYHWRNDNNSLANFTLLTQETNRRISAKLPEEYFPYYEEKHPGVLASHWIPDDPELWKIENYRDFLAARRELLSKAANDFLDQLYNGSMPESATERDFSAVPGGITNEAEEELILEVMSWMDSRQLPHGQIGYELVDSQNNDVLAVLDLAWSDGIQVGKSHPVALLIDEEDETLQLASRNGFICFTTVEHLQRYVQREILGETPPV